MTVTIANTELVDSFNTWRLNTNLISTVVGNNVVTVTKTGAARGGTTKGDGHIKGTFSANDLRSSAIRGGNTTNQSAITLHSNTTIEARTFTINANTEFTGNINFTTTGDDRIIMGDISRIRITGGNSGDFLRRSESDLITATTLSLRNLGDLSSNAAHLILSSANTNFAQELNTPDLRFSAGTNGQDVIRLYGDGEATAGDSDLLMQLVSADGDSNFKIQTVANNNVHTFGADGSVSHTGRITSVGLTSSGTILPSGGAVDLGSSGAQFKDGYFDGTVITDKLQVSDTASEGVDSNLVPAAHNTHDLGNASFMYRNMHMSGTANINTLAVVNNATIGGTLGITGDLTVQNFIAQGNIDLGNATTDTVTVTGQFDSDLIPSTDNARDLGSSSKEWKDLYLTGVGYIDELSVAVGSGQGVSTSLIPKTNAAGSLGSTTREWNNLFVDGTAHIDTLDIDENATITGTLGVTGTTTVSTINATNITASGTTGLAATTVSTLGATGAVDFDSTLNVDGNSTLNALTVTSLTANTAVDFNSTLNVDGNTTLKGDVTLGDATGDAITINGTIAGTSNFTNLAVSNNTDLGDNSSDTLTITASVDSNILPTGTVNLGATSSRWSTVYATNLVANNVTLGASGEGPGNSFTIHGDITLNGNLNQASGQTVSAPAGSFTNITAGAGGLLKADGNVDLGSDASDTVTINGVVDSNFIPSGTRDLGSSSARWDVGYFNDINVADDFALTDDLTVGGDAGITGTVTAGALNVSGATNMAGDVDFDGAITRDGGTVLFDTNGVLNQASIATNAIASSKLTSVVTGASVGSASAVPVITFNNKGQITAASTATVAGVTGFAVGSGTNGKTFTITTADGSTFPATVGAGSIGTTEMSTISGLSAQAYGSATQVPVITVNAQGRVTAASQVAVAGISSVGYTSANNNVRISTGDGKTHDLTVAPASSTVKGVASFDSGDFDVSGAGAVTLKNATTGAVITVQGTADEVDVGRAGGTVTVGLPQDVTIGRDLTVTRDVAITGDLTVSGTTTTVNSTTVSIADPIFELGESGSDDNLDRGIIMKYNNSGSKKAFMGFDDSDHKFTMIPDATDTASVMSGTVGTLKANLEGNSSGTHNGAVTGDVTGNITSTGASAFSGTVDFSGATINNMTVSSIAADISGNAATTTALQNARTIGGVSFNGTSNINLPGVNTSGNQNTSGNAATATKLVTGRTIGGASFDGTGNIDVKVKTVSDNSTNADKFITFVDSTTTTAVQDIKEDADLKYRPFTGVLSSTNFTATANATINKIHSSDGHVMLYKTGSSDGNARLNGIADLATQWETARQLTLSGVISGTATGINGGGNISVTTTFASGGNQAATSDIGDAQITANKLALNSVETGKIPNNAVTTTKIANDAITNAKIAPNSITDTEIANSGSFSMGALTVDNIILDGNEIDVGSGNLTLDVNNNINLNADGGEVRFQDNNATYGIIANSGGNIQIRSGSTTMLTGSGQDVAFARNITNGGTIVAGGDITAFSDARLKHDVKTIDNALDKVDNLRGVTYRMLEDETHAEKVGVIAQEVEEILPQVVHTSDDEMQTKSVDYGKLCAVLIEAVKELKKEVEELKGR